MIQSIQTGTFPLQVTANVKSSFHTDFDNLSKIQQRESYPKLWGDGTSLESEDTPAASITSSTRSIKPEICIRFI